ncbi:MAG: VWA domain-containing protein [Gemmatimonadetes bacterium]|nr:VWA domain-containing protein [Gemmatimonadota bacterium]MCY3944239.1 VWA domain-containing protein [Gemmatimonadota bacterium]
MILRFDDPLLFLLLLGVAGLGWWRLAVADRRRRSLRHPDTVGLAGVGGDRSRWIRHVAPTLRGLACVCLVVALARPQTGVTAENVSTEAVDIVLAIDISSSMLAEDLAPNRLEAAKEVAADFAAARTSDRIGVVIFAGKAFTQAPLTLDHSVVESLIGELEVGMVEDGTAVGMGLATAVKRLQASEAASKVVILLTDGRNNRGEIDPITAADAAAALGVRVYTIGAGAQGAARVPVTDRFGNRRYATMRVDVDEATLRATAEKTGGRYYRATDRASLEAIYAEIDELETTAILVENFTSYGERFRIPLVAGLILLLAEAALASTWLRTIP